MRAPSISEVPLSKLADSVFSVGFDCENCSRGGRGGIGAAKDQDVGTGGRLEVESGIGEGMDSSVVFAEDFIDANNLVDMGFGVGVYLFNGVEVWGSGADIRQ